MNDLLAQGGPVLLAIGALSLLAWTLVFRQALVLRREAPAAGGARQDEARALAVARLRAPLRTVAAIAAVCPLLGLLGTVLGMVGTFGAIRAGGTDPVALAAGVSEALVTTQAGLLAGLPLLLGHHWIASRVEAAAEASAAAARPRARSTSLAGGGAR